MHEDGGFSRRLEEESVFGMARDLDAKAVATVFIGLIFLLVCLEIGFTSLEHWAEHHHSSELFEKLKKELTMMGILSFTVFVLQTVYANATENDYYEAFEMSHIVILFIAIAFIIQASFLLNFAIKEGDYFLKMSRTTPEDLLSQYKHMRKSSTFQSWLFDHAPFWFPTVPSFRNEIRSKLIELLFINQHKLPDEFRFPQYISKLFQKYISELGEVSPLNWILLGTTVALNYGKIRLIDRSEVESICGESPAEPDAGLERRFLHEGEFVICYEYIFSYALIVTFLLFVVIICVYVSSAYYFEQLLREACSREGVTVTRESGRKAYIDVLKNMMINDEKQAEKRATSSASDTKVKIFEEVHATTKGLSHASTKVLFKTGELRNPLLGKEHIRSSDGDLDEREDILEVRIEDQLEEIKEIENEEKEENAGCLHSFIKCITQAFATSESIGNLQSIFWLNSSGMFFSMVELVLLLQCFYMAMWATQLVPMIVLYGENVVSWIIWFTVPIIINFMIIRLTLTRAVMLQAICGVHAEVLGEVKEEAIEEEHCLDKLRHAVRERFSGLNAKDLHGKLSKEELTKMKVNLKLLFDKYDKDGSGDIGKKEFLQLLTDLKVFLSKRAFKILWQAVDYDLSGEISWEEMFIILFPELKSLLKEELEIVASFRRAISDRLMAQGILEQVKMTEYMRAEFDKFDVDQSGSIDESEMLLVVKDYMPLMRDKDAKKLFAAIDVDGEGGIDWKEFRELIFGIQQIQKRRSSGIF
jgi:Ca2+-binding EF-hand superfamily protein